MKKSICPGFLSISLAISWGIFGAIAISGTMLGCSTTQVSEDDPKSMYDAAESDIKSDRYLMAIEKLRTVKNKFPYSQYSILAKLRMADVYFLEESYPEAATAYELFRELHPTHEKAPYAYFRSAESYYLDAPSTVARDLSSVSRALELYEGFLSRYPLDPQAPEAQKRISEARSKLAEKEFSIGSFYQKQEKFKASLARYKKVVELYPETESARKAKEHIPQLEKLAE